MTDLPITLETIFALPALPLEHRELLPEIPGLYFAYTLNDERQLLYIGKAQNIRQQWSQHPRIRDLQLVANVVSQINLAWLEFYANEEILTQQEHVLIKRFRPAINELNLIDYERMRTDNQPGHTSEEYSPENRSVVGNLQGSQRLIEALPATDEPVDAHPDEEVPIDIFPQTIYQPQKQRDFWTFLVFLVFIVFVLWGSFF
ncbi:MAG: GIY-YIG nuclease family protein [Symploca sp. SIO1B1]|nr:GIY-YIG nuclease family protein [Symploca sp. SIO1C2]NER49180.1 GIY-YIG nuclease family protein [Symploca sp. SIO1A3]NER92767.1 GIY-YIG nuclease family protein [Symploca sp. SIO1B1]